MVEEIRPRWEGRRRIAVVAWDSGPMFLSLSVGMNEQAACLDYKP